MRPVHILILVVAFLSACQSGKNAKDGLPFTKDSLMGNWMVLRVKASLKSMNSERREELQDYKDSVMEPLYNNLELAAFRFQPASVITVDDGKIEKTTGNWLFNDTKKELLLQYKYLIQKNRSLFTVEHYWNDSLQLENVIPRNKDTMYVRYFLKKLRTNDSVPNLFDPALNKWRERPLQPESLQAIRLRMQQLLYYYTAYFANISGNKIPYFNLTKILCPIKFYNGGIGIKRYQENDDWTKVFYENQDAKKAYDMIVHAFSDIKGYPNKNGDYVKEYVIALKLVADAL